MNIDGSTRLVGLIGWPVAHSLSPAMHNAAFAARGLNYVYLPLAVPPGQVGWAVRGLKALGFVGANITVPHKESVVPYLDELSLTAVAVGAANTLVVQPDGALWGDDTDGPGFLADLRDHGIDPSGARSLVLGAGGAAHAVAHALADAGASVAVANRTPAKAEELSRALRAIQPAAQIEAHSFPDDLAELAQGADIIVNATSLGLSANGQDRLPWDPSVPFRRGQVVYDLVYSGEGKDGAATPFLKLAAQQGATALDGLGMLVHQGALAWQRWTGQEAPIEAMREAVRKA